MASKPSSRDKGNSFLRVFRILETVVASKGPQTASEISAAVGLPNPTTHRLCKMLVEQRLLQYELDGKRLLGGPRLFDFAGQIMSASNLDLERRAILEKLVDDIGETCNISVPDGTRMIYADRVEAQWPLRMQLPTGTHVPLHCTASGKLYLSQMEPRALDIVLERLELNKLARRTIVDADRLKAELKRTRERGYSKDNEEFIEGLVAVAVPVRGPRGRFCAGLAVHAPKFRMTMKDVLAQLPRLRAAADQIEYLMRDAAA
ncbi:MAG: IclR family transcriptional regulator [Hyphomicrobiales bacterium]|nr:IclR family transcriptional regulator [Hyphomicrobiales bacterium]